MKILKRPFNIILKIENKMKMKKIRLLYCFLCWAIAINAQVPFRKITTEPAIGTHIWSISGAVDLQCSNLLQYNVNQRINLISYTALSFDVIKFSAFEDINPKHSFTIFQRIGVGTSLNTKRSTNTFSLLGGVKYFSYAGSTENPNLEEKITTKRGIWATDYGAMYNLKIGRKKYFFSSRIFIPLYGGKWGILESGSIDFGIGIRLK